MNILPLLLCALAASFARAEDADPASQEVLEQIRGREWKYDNPSTQGFNWAQVTFYDEASGEDLPSRTLWFSRYNYGSKGEDALDVTPKPNLPLLVVYDRKKGNGYTTSAKSNLSVYYIVSLNLLQPNGHRSNEDPFTAVISRRDKPSIRILGKGKFFGYGSTSYGRGEPPEVAELRNPIAITMPREVDMSPSIPLTAVLEERSPRLDYPDPDGNSQRIQCRDTSTALPHGGARTWWDSPLAADPVRSLFSRSEDIVMTALAPSGQRSLVDSQAADKGVNPASLNGADLGGFVSATRAEQQRLAADLKRRIEQGAPADYFLPEESRLLICYARFLGEAVEKAFYASLRAPEQAGDKSAQARAGVVSFWRPAALALLGQADDQGKKISQGKITVGRNWHSTNDAEMRKINAEIVKQFGAVKDWAAYKPSNGGIAGGGAVGEGAERKVGEALRAVDCPGGNCKDE